MEIIKFVAKDHGEGCFCSFCIIKRELVSALKKMNCKFALEELDEDKVPDGIKLGHSGMFVVNGKKFLIYLFENSLLPKRWVSYFNKNMDYVICVSRYLEKVFLDSGIFKHKLLYSPLGIDTDIFRPCDKVNKTNDGMFRFLNIGVIEPASLSTDRKGRDILIDCYRETFRGIKDVALLIKSNRRIEGIVTDMPKIEFITDFCSKESMADLYGTVALRGAYIATDRAEGFRMPAMEALACELNVAMPAFSGNAAELGEYVTLFPYKKEQSFSSFRIYYDTVRECPEWGVPDKKSICDWMWHVYKNPSKFKYAAKIRNKFDWTELTKQLVNKMYRKVEE